MTSNKESRNASSTAESGASTPTPAKNATGMKTDPTWEYCVLLDPITRKVKCKFCESEVTGGIYRFKHNLAGNHNNVKMCLAVPDGIKIKMVDRVYKLQTKLLQKSQEVSIEDDNSTATGLKSFKKMFEYAIKHGIGFKPPTYHEIRVKYLDYYYGQINNDLEEHRAVWRKLGYTIMTDGWTNRRRRTILNFLVNSPKGTVFLNSIDASDITKTADKIFKMIDDIIEEVGEENVVQVVTNNAANYKAAWELLMEKRTKLYWTPCAAHCIDLMLEDFEKKIPLHKDTIAKGKKITTYIYARTSLISLLHKFTNNADLIRPAMTRFATSY
ncbi:uncharacterized protein LOC131613382 [Vicia villosa]|uniref:uncharacterized protein LOC131613382 n=1 Tax=Vicia villosa TaxID=3911 RepID=UPI00273AE022|nr:uncharacterized protein LOC131613382 [Vicia villosa]